MTDGVPTATDRLASFVTGTPPAAIPPDVAAWASLLVLDAVGTAVGNRDAPFGRAMRSVVAAGARSGPSLVLAAGGLRLVPEAAAEVNSAAVHGSDLDATHIASIIHPTAVCVPVGLAVGEAEDASGAETLAAVALGMEALVRLGLAARGGFHLRGFQPTALLGPMAAAMMAARLRGGTADEAAEAAGLATAIGAGLRSFSDDGTWGKRLITGWACRAGIHADALVAAGYRGTRTAVEKRWGIYSAFLGEDVADVAAITDGLGERWHLLDTEPKRYPCSHGLHPYIEAALAARGRVAVDRIRRVECVTNDEAVRWWFEPSASRYRPDAYGARFSIPYAVARALLDGDVTDASFEADAVADPAVLELTARIVPAVDPALRDRPPVGLPGTIRLTLDDGAALEVAGGHSGPDGGAWVEQRAVEALTRSMGAELARATGDGLLSLGSAPAVRPVLAPLA
jgi:2-methylcitrate dehydratase PrpD